MLVFVFSLLEKLWFILNLDILALTCLATVSNQVIVRKLARKLEQERKKYKIEGGGRGGEGKRGDVSFSPLPSPWDSSFVLSSQLSRPTRADTLATQASLALAYDVNVFLGAFFHRMLGSVNLTTVEVKGVAAALNKHAPKGESKGVKAYFRMDENGLLNLEKVGYCVFYCVSLGGLSKYRMGMGYSYPNL